MLDSDIERTVVGCSVALWFAHGWYLNARLRDVHRKLDLALESFDGLREYLYEIDAQFNDERQIRAAVLNDESLFAGKDEVELLSTKKLAGKRTLNTSFVSRQ